MTRLALLLGLALSFGLLAACESEGPMEEAGENIDQAVEDTGEALEEGAEG